MQPRPAKPETTGTVRVLVVSPYAEDHRALAAIIRHSKWRLLHASELCEAADLMRTGGVSVVICEHASPFGHWHEIAAAAERAPVRPRLLVCSAHADDRMWAEVLNEGGYDCLLKPFRAEEVFRLVGAAWRSWHAESCRIADQARPSEGMSTAVGA